MGSLTDAGVDHDDADAYAEGVRRGGTLVTVRADNAMLARAAQIMDVDGAADLDERRTAWGSDGWTSGVKPNSGVMTGVGSAIAGGATRAKDAVEQTGARIADAVTPDRTIATGSGFESTSGAQPGAMGLSAQTGRVDQLGRRVRTY